MNIAKIMNFLAKGNKWQFDIPADEQIAFVNKLGEPVNDIQRSFFQYKAQMYFVGLPKRLIFNTICLFAVPVLWIALTIKGIFVIKGKTADTIIQKNNYSGVIPEIVNASYDISKDDLWDNGASLSLKDALFLSSLIKYYFHSPYFVFKIMYKVALYSQMIRRHHPRAIIVFNEYSFTSSALTAYCETNKVEHIDIMHGEKLLYIRDSFFRFSKTYIWEDYYKDLFIKLKAFPDQFITAMPPFMKIDIECYKNNAVHSKYKYFLARYTEDELKSIVNSMKTVSNGERVTYRPHPRYSNIELLEKYVPKDCIEFPSDINIMESLANCDTAVGCYTTVLNQAYHSGINVILDDVAFPDSFRKLAELEYVLLDKKLKRISEILKS